jgi:hypothetical protein
MLKSFWRRGAKTAGVEFTGDLPEGKEIRLDEQDMQSLSYQNYCWHETITGGVATVDNERQHQQLATSNSIRGLITCASLHATLL